MATMADQGVTAVEHSNNSKLARHGNVSATYVAQQSCPTSCALRDAGCYAELGRMGIHARRLNRAAKGRHRLTLAKLEAAAIAALSGYHKLRVHVVGDCATVATAALVGAAMRGYERKHGRAAWTYTHAWRNVALKAWQGARVLASCDHVQQVAAARRRGYAVAVVVPPHPSEKLYQLGGETIVPCPAQFKRADGARRSTCEECTLCQRPELLRAKGWAVGFQPDATTGAAVLRLHGRIAR